MQITGRPGRKRLQFTARPELKNGSQRTLRVPDDADGAEFSLGVRRAGLGQAGLGALLLERPACLRFWATAKQRSLVGHDSNRRRRAEWPTAPLDIRRPDRAGRGDLVHTSHGRLATPRDRSLELGTYSN